MSRRGLSLIEVIFTASLLALVFMVLLSIFPTANGIAGAILDGCRSGPFTHLATDQTVDLTTPGALGDILRRSNLKGDDGMVFTPVLRVGPSPTSTVPRTTLCQLTVDVSWKERSRTPHITRTLQVSSLNR